MANAASVNEIEKKRTLQGIVNGKIYLASEHSTCHFESILLLKRICFPA